MFGQNEVRHKTNSPGYLQVHKIFYTLQGEGPFVGQPAIFIRLSGCNLRCTFCDTNWDDKNDPYMSIKEIIEQVHYQPYAWSPPLIVLTGGEPLRQNLELLIQSFYARSFHVQIETAGTFWEDYLKKYIDLGVLDIVVSPKTPKIHPEIYQHAAAFKYVIEAGHTDEKDGLPTKGTQPTYEVDGVRVARPRPGAPVYLSPCDVGINSRNKRNQEAVVKLAMRHNYIAGLQLHKIWGVE